MKKSRRWFTDSLRTARQSRTDRLKGYRLVEAKHPGPEWSGSRDVGSEVKAANKSRVDRRFCVRRSFKTDKQETEPEIEVVKYKLYLGAFR